MGEPPLRGRYHVGKPLTRRTSKKNLIRTVAGQVFPNEATAFHPSLPQRSRLASRVSALGLGRTQAAERRSTAHADRWCRMEFVHALDIRTACRSRLQPQGRWGRSNANLSRGQSCMSLSSCSECDGPDRVLPGLIQLPARDGAYKSRCSVLDVMEASTRLINAVPPDVVLAACRALRMAAAAITYLLRSVDVGAQAPTPVLGKMASWPSCAMRCAKIQVESTGPCSRCCCLVSQNN